LKRFLYYPTLRDGKIKRLEIKGKGEDFGSTVPMASLLGCFIDIKGKIYGIRYNHK